MKNHTKNLTEDFTMALCRWFVLRNVFREIIYCTLSCRHRQGGIIIINNFPIGLYISKWEIASEIAWQRSVIISGQQKINKCKLCKNWFTSTKSCKCRKSYDRIAVNRIFHRSAVCVQRSRLGRSADPCFLNWGTGIAFGRCRWLPCMRFLGSWSTKKNENCAVRCIFTL